MKTEELIGPTLDWAVAKCEGVSLVEHIDGLCSWLEHEVSGYWVVYSPSTDWVQGGPIIKQEKINVQVSCVKGWAAYVNNDELTDDLHHGLGDTPLIAAMRCFVASKLGDEVEIPEELK